VVGETVERRWCGRGRCGRLAACFRLDLPPRSQREGSVPKRRLSLKLYCWSTVLRGNRINCAQWRGRHERLTYLQIIFTVYFFLSRIVDGFVVPSGMKYIKWTHIGEMSVRHYLSSEIVCPVTIKFTFKDHVETWEILSFFAYDTMQSDSSWLP